MYTANFKYCRRVILRIYCLSISQDCCWEVERGISVPLCDGLFIPVEPDRSVSLQSLDLLSIQIRNKDSQHDQLHNGCGHPGCTLQTSFCPGCSIGRSRPIDFNDIAFIISAMQSGLAVSHYSYGGVDNMKIVNRLKMVSFFAVFHLGELARYP